MPEDADWSRDVAAAQLARCSATRLTCSETKQERGEHVCNDPLLSGINSNLWFPLSAGEDWHAGIEWVLVMDGVAENVVHLDPLRDCPEYRDFKVIYNRKIFD